MQLQHYVAILWRFWALIVALPLLVGAVSLALALGQPQRYAATARLMVSQTPLAQDAASPFPDVNVTGSWQSSAYILDDLPLVVSSVTFSQDVSERLAGQGYAIAPEMVQAGLRAESFHRSVTLFASADSPDGALAILRGAVETLQANGLRYWDRTGAGAPGLSVAVLDPPGGVRPLGSLRATLVDVGLRVALALAAAVGLAFLVHYFDDRLRGPRQIEEWTGLRVLGVIPRE